MAYGETGAYADHGNQVSAAVRKNGELTEVVARLNALTNEIDGSAGRIATALDRMHGSRPTETLNSDPKGAPSNTLSELRDRLERLQRISGWLSDSAQRIESIA